MASGLLLLAVLNIGCETASQQLKPGTADFIKPGSTTREELIKIFGEPKQTITGGNRTLLFWRLVVWASPANTTLSGVRGFSDDSFARGLSVLCDANNVVIAKHYSEHSFHTMYGAGVVTAGQSIDDKRIALVKVDQTDKTNLIKMFGEPMMESLALDGSLVLDWAYEAGNYIGGETELRVLRAVLDPQGIVKAIRIVNDHQ